MTEMEIVPDEKAGIRFRNWLVHEELRESVRLLEIETARSQEFLIICSWCKRVKLDEDVWVEVEEAVQKLGLFETAVLPQLSHGMCPDCAQTWLA